VTIVVQRDQFHNLLHGLVYLTLFQLHPIPSRSTIHHLLAAQSLLHSRKYDDVITNVICDDHVTKAPMYKKRLHMQHVLKQSINSLMRILAIVKAACWDEQGALYGQELKRLSATHRSPLLEWKVLFKHRHTFLQVCSCDAC
jgi:hypothetical protein